MDKVRVVVWGLGAVARRRERHGDDLGQVVGAGRSLGVRVSGEAAELLPGVRPDVVLHATTSFVEEAFGELTTAIRCGANVITIAEEMAYPRAADPGRAQEIDSLAKRYGVCGRVDRIREVRLNDLPPYGPTVLGSGSPWG